MIISEFGGGINLIDSELNIGLICDEGNAIEICDVAAALMREIVSKYLVEDVG